MNLPTFSALPRAFRCRMSTVLPRVDHESEAAHAGTVRHRFLQRITELAGAGKSVEQARELALSEVELDDERDACAMIPVEILQLEGVAAEVAVAIDLETGTARELGRGIERDYQGVRPSEIVGTIDRLALLGDDGAYVGDWKGRSHRRQADQDEQLLAGALAAARLYGRTWVRLEVIKLIDGEPFHSEGKVQAFDLDAYELRLQELQARIIADRNAYRAGDLPPAETGDHCTYCSSAPYCPARFAVARAVLGGDSQEILALAKQGAAYITDENAVRLLELISTGEKVLKVVKEAVADHARAHPVALPDGRVYGVNPESTEREITDGRKAAAVLQELLGEDATKVGSDVKVSFTSIERGVKAWLTEHPEKAGRGAIKQGVEEITEALARRGLVRTITGGVVRAFTPKTRKAKSAA